MTIKEKLKAVGDFLRGSAKVKAQNEAKFLAQARSHAKVVDNLNKEIDDLKKEIDELYRLIPKRQASE